MQNTLVATNPKPKDFNPLSNSWFELYDLIQPKKYDWPTLLDYREQFTRTGYLKLPDFLSDKALQLIKNEMLEMESIAIRKKFEMPGYLTPRSLSVLGGSSIKSESPTLYSLYHLYSLRSLIESITGRLIYSCSHPEEFMVANFLNTTGDTHGWHLDDPSYALIIFTETPPKDSGGELEFISNWKDLCRRKGCKPDENIYDLLCWANDNGLIDRESHKAGDAYLLRADLNLHRVTPLLTPGDRRSVLNLAYQSSPDMSYGATADLLYGY